MAMVFIDGADHYASADITKKWTAINTSVVPVVNTSGGRRGGGCLALLPSAWVNKAFPAKQSIIVGYALFLPAMTESERPMVAFYSGGNAQVVITVNSTGGISAKRGGTGGALLGSVGGAINTNVWQYIEIGVTCSDTSGSVKVKINGQTALDLTNVDTVSGTNAASVDGAYFYGCGGGSDHAKIDDVYIVNVDGTLNNTYLGDVRIDTVRPNAAGTHQQFTPSSGTDHVALVNETTPDTTGYVTGGGAGSKETFHLGDLSGSNTVLGVQVNSFVAKTDAGVATVKNIIRSGTTEAAGASMNPSTEYAYTTSVFETNPDTAAAWTVAGVNGMEAGVEVVA